MKIIGHSISHIIDIYRKALIDQYPLQEINQICSLLAEEFLNWRKIELHKYYNRQLDPEIVILFEQALDRLLHGEPVQYILGYSWFFDRKFIVNQHVLIPRPETEQLCQIISESNTGRLFQQFSILDIGTGSGIIAITLKGLFPYAMVTGLDNNSGALDVAKENAQLLKQDVKFVSNDIHDQARWLSLGKFDMMVSNPPYVLNSERRLMHNNVLNFEPPGALFVPDNDPLIYYQAISAFAWRNLLRPGLLYLEINEQFGSDVKQLLINQGFEKCKVLKDFHDRDRFVVAEARMGILDQSYWYEGNR